MTITRTSYRLEKPVLYNLMHAQALHAALIEPEMLSKIGGYRQIIAGSFLATGNRILPRATVISPYASGESQVIVNNPAAFIPGDVIRVIGTVASSSFDEAQSITMGTAPIFGTVTSVEGGIDMQKTTVTPNSVAVGNIFVLDIEGIKFSYIAETTSNEDVVNGLKQAFLQSKSQTSVFNDDGIRLVGTPTELTIESHMPREVITVKANVIQGDAATVGTLDVEVTQAVGAVLITPQGSNASLEIGAKIGTITDLPLGVITHDYYLTDDDGNDVNCRIAAYDMASVNTNALPYLDGAIVMQQLPKLSFIPAYGI